MQEKMLVIINLVMTFAVTGVPVVVGFQLPQSTVPEGATLESCVEIFSGIAEALHVVQITTVPISASS